MNIAYVALAPFISGSERCLQLILEQGRNSKDADLILITPKTSPLKDWALSYGIKHFSVELESVDKKKVFRWGWNQLKLIWLLWRNHIDLVHSNQIWSYPVLGLSAKLLKIKTICHLRDPVTNGSKWWLKPAPDSIICISKHIQQEYISHFGEHYSKSIHTLIDPVAKRSNLEIGELSKKKNQYRTELKLPMDIFLFGYIGQVAPIKGVLEMLRVLALLPRKDWHLVIAGKDPSKEQLYMLECKTCVAELGLDNQVTFVGFLENTQTFYYSIDLVLMFSKEEPLGLIPLEAGMHYKPSIASAVGGLPETIIDSETGWLIDYRNLEDTIGTISSAMDSDLDKVGIRARTWAYNTCDPFNYWEKLIHLYQCLHGGKCEE